MTQTKEVTRDFYARSNSQNPTSFIIKSFDQKLQIVDFDRCAPPPKAIDRCMVITLGRASGRRNIDDDGRSNRHRSRQMTRMRKKATKGIWEERNIQSIILIFLFLFSPSQGL